MITSLASTLTGIPWVYHVHRPGTADSANRLSNLVNAWIEKQSLRGCEHVITVSESLRWDCIAQGADENNVTVVHNGVPAIRPERDSIPEPGGQWTIGMVALMRPRQRPGSRARSDRAIGERRTRCRSSLYRPVRDGGYES